MASFYAENVESIKQKIIFSQIEHKNIEIIKAQNVKNVKDSERKSIEEPKKLIIYQIMLES